jgi:uncharacterized membrane protein HdeD (DUF308 family)
MSSMTIGATLLSDLHQRVEEKIAEYKGWYLLQSLTFVCAGLLAMILPLATSLAFGSVMGILLIVTGVLKAFVSIKSHIHWWSMLSAAVCIAVGSLLVWPPASGIITVSLLVAVFLLGEGLIEICLAFEYESARNWAWLLLSGVISILLSLVLFIGWPDMASSILGVMIGVSMLLYGASLLALSASTRALDIL